jgi:hypothetical protein
MTCELGKCAKPAAVLLTKDVERPTNCCADCASYLLDRINPFSYMTTAEMSFADEAKALRQLNKQ